MRTARGSIHATTAATAFAIAVCPGCEDPPPRTRELVVVIQTDVALPDAIDSVRVEAWVNGRVAFGADHEVGSGKLLVPTALHVLGGSAPGTPVTVRLIGRKAGKPKLLREARTTIPPEGAAVLRMPIRWLCDDSAKEVSPSEVANATCPADQTCIGGDCASAVVDSTRAPSYAHADVFGGGTPDGGGQCFDVLACTRSARRVLVDPATCTFPRPADLSTLNVALRVSDDGICEAARTSCFVVLDRARDDGSPLDGWRPVGDRVELTKAVCARLSSGRVQSVVISDACPSKVDTLPVCGPWTNIGARDAGPPDDGAAPSADAGVLPATEIAGAIPTGATAHGLEVLSHGMHGFEMRVAGSFLVYPFQRSRASGIAALPLPPPPPPAPATPEIVAEVSGRLVGPWIRPDAIFWADWTELHGTSTTTIAPSSRGAASLAGIWDLAHFVDAADAQRLYGAGFDASAISAIATTGGGPTLLGSALTKQQLQAVVADPDPSGHLYVATTGRATTDRAQIERIAKSGGPSTTVAVLPTVGLSSLILDGADLYVAGFDPNDDRSGSIHRVPTTGAPPVLVVDELTRPASLTVAGDWIYWASNRPDGSNQILRAPKTGGPAMVVFESQDLTVSTLTAGPDRIYFAGNQRGQGKLLYIPR